MGGRPVDECPYKRPLREHFDACPTFHPVQFLPLNAMYEPLRPVLSCRHMEVALRLDRPGRSYYCRCAVGDAATRQRVAEQVGEERRQLMRELADGLMQVVATNWETIGTVKARELKAETEAEMAEAELEVAAAAEFIAAEMRRLVEGKLSGHVARLGIRRAALLRIIDAGVRDYQEHGFAAWVPDQELLDDMPADVARFLRPAASPAVVSAV